MRSSHAAHRHVRTFARVSIVALLAGLLHVVAAAPASAAVPTGVVDALSSPSPGRIYTGGWAFDSDEPSRYTAIHVYVGGYGVNIGEARLYRPDVHSVYGTGEYHGFDAAFDVPVVGDLAWEVYGIDTQGGPPALIGSGRVFVADPSPVGAIESSSSSVHRTVDLAGWASDPNSPTSSLNIGAYVGGPVGTPGVEATSLTASITRTDGKKGFSARLTTAKTGKQPVYVYAGNVPGTPGGDRLIGVVQVTIYVDTTPPDTKITSAPATATTNDVVQVSFSADEPNATFECRWDQEAWFACQTGAPIKLAPGKHQIAVRASDAYGNQDATPAVFLVTVTAAATTQPPPPGEQPARSIVAKAVKKKSKLRIDVGPDSASSNYRVVIQRKAGKRWRKVERVRTRGPKDKVVVDLRRGRYRVVLPTSAAGPALTSATVRLRR